MKASKLRAVLRHPLTRVALTVGALALLIVALPVGSLWEVIGRMPHFAWPAAIAVYLGLHLLGITKWRRVMNAAGAELPFRISARAYYMGLFGGTFLPSLVGGDAVRAGIVYRAARSKSGLVLASAIDRGIDVIGLAAVAGVGALLSPLALDQQSRSIFVALGGSLALVGGAAALAAYYTPVRRFPWKVRRLFVKIRRALRAMSSRPQALVYSLISTIVLQALLALLNWWLALAIDVRVPFYVWIFVWPLAKVAAMVPITQNGIGVREVAYVALCAPFGISAPEAVAASLVFQVVVLGGGLVSGAVGWWLDDRSGAVATDDPTAGAMR